MQLWDWGCMFLTQGNLTRSGLPSGPSEICQELWSLSLEEKPGCRCMQNPRYTTGGFMDP